MEQALAERVQGLGADEVIARQHRVPIQTLFTASVEVAVHAVAEEDAAATVGTSNKYF
jgi:hypothetical protein